MAHSHKSPSFESLEFKKPRTRVFWASVGIHAVLLSVAVLLPLIFTDTLRIRSYDIVSIVPPPQPRDVLEVTKYRLPPPVERPPERIVAPPPRIPELTKPDIAELEKPELPEVRLKPKLIDSGVKPPAPPPPEPKAEVRTGLFSTGSSAKPNVDLPARQVQTGGFGDPNGATGEGRPDKVANIASLGSFDLPTGPGVGNGTGGSKGTRGVTASSGFGSGVAPGQDGNGNGRAVRQGGFGDTQTAAPPPSRKQAEVARETPVEIIFKPKPDYTEEARSKKAEGEVLLRIAFGANGAVRVLETLRGLGYGLDQNAIRAAQQIKFKPAMRDGKPIDSIAIVHIVFQMAY